MSAPVDVLRVMQHAVSVLHGTADDGADTRRYADALHAAKGAVAELIEAGIGVHAACRDGKEPDLIALADALDGVGAKAARKAALARIGGAK
ncbi:MAG TPA: hypothetical protein VGU03_11065 [Frateuria sp.]|uniref:hypothetical protein n=1 Tax=Frateuria sp. TaxID=2211372 RepID=UPI002DF11516|nr:hypothetical protein [Frateuria sp.]